MSSIRTQIRKAQGARLAVLLNMSTGTLAKAVRSFVSDRPWKPQNAPMTRCTVQDNGQSRAGYRDAETEKSFALETEIVLDLPVNWGSEYDTWCDIVEGIVDDFQNRLFDVPGALRCEYVDDDPVNVVLTDGATHQVWVLHFKTTFAKEVGEIGKS